jgi:predicted glutamine amidotransferase
MCELLGMECNVPTDIVFSFTGFALRGGKTGPHADGWGVALYEGRFARSFLEPRPACESPLADFIRDNPIKTLLAIAHVRKKTRGASTLENTHPFKRTLWGRHWVFAHNGTLPRIKARRLHDELPIGETDSEHAFCWLMQELAKAHAGMPAIGELSNTLSELLPQLHRHGTFNMLLSNGQALWAHCSTQLHYVVREHPFGAPVLADKDVMVDFAAHTGPHDRVAIVATEPLTRNEPWQAMGAGQLMTFTGGTVATRQCAEMAR